MICYPLTLFPGLLSRNWDVDKILSEKCKPFSPHILKKINLEKKKSGHHKQCWADQEKVTVVIFLRKPIKVSTSPHEISRVGVICLNSDLLWRQIEQNQVRETSIYFAKELQSDSKFVNTRYIHKKFRKFVFHIKNTKMLDSSLDFSGCLENGEWYFWSNTIQNQLLSALKFKSSTCKCINFSQKQKWMKVWDSGPRGEIGWFLAESTRPLVPHQTSKHLDHLLPQLVANLYWIKHNHNTTDVYYKCIEKVD